MFNIKLYIVVLLTLNLFYGCNKPSPTELTEDLGIEVETISSDIDDEFYSNGFDSTGLVEMPLRYSNIVTISGIKTTDGRRQSVYSSFAQTIFYDTALPVYTRDGKLIGYYARVPGIVKFNNITARKEQYRIRFRGPNGPVDTTLGSRFVLNGGRGMHSDPFSYEYGSFVSFEYIPENSTEALNINIPTPREITASAAITGSFENSNLSVLLEWNRAGTENFEVVISGIKNRNEVVPLYRVKTPDDGSLIIPSSLINMIPRDKFINLDFSLIRRIELDNKSRFDLHIISQSIHRIVLDNP